MANAGVFAQDTDINLRAGTNSSATTQAAGWYDSIIIDVEAFINNATRKDWSALDNATTMNASVRGMLVETGACLAAIQGINFDMDSIGRSTAESMITVLRDIALRNIQILRDIKTQTFILGVAP